MKVLHLYRYPVKGLTHEKLTNIAVTEGDPIPWDRAFALAMRPIPFDPHNPKHLPKICFLQLMRNEKAALLQSRFEPGTGMLFLEDPEGKNICDNVLTDEGRARVAEFIVNFMGRELFESPRLLYAANHSFSDARERAISIINLASIRDLEQRISVPRHLMRFRANVYLDGLDPWEENDWIDRHLRIGTSVIRVIRPIPRCQATQVNPETAKRDADPIRELRSSYGHVNLGHFAEVVASGEITEGSRVIFG